MGLSSEARCGKGRLERDEWFEMSRILKAYRTRFHQLLRLAGARRLEQGVGWLEAKARRMSSDSGISLAEALTRTHEELSSRPPLQARRRQLERGPEDIMFLCDGGLGGLARWLRAAGYRALWEP